MAHIVIDARVINSSTGTYVERLLHYLEKIDHQNRYTVLVPSKDLDFYRPTNRNFQLVAADFPNYSFSEQTGFKKLLESLKPDLVHFCMPQQPILYKGKTVTTFHDLSLLRIYNSDKNWLAFHLKQLVGKFVFRRVAKKSNIIITPTNFVKNDLEKTFGINGSKIKVTYEAAETKINKTTPYLHDFSDFILYVGQQSDYKNIPRLAAAHQKLLQKHPNLGLVLVGKINNSARKNQDLFVKNNYQNIIFTDFIANDQRDWLYSKAAVYAFPSLTEGFGLPGLEAMAMGAPVASSNYTCLPEVYGDAALYFDPTDIDSIVNTLDQIISDDNLRNQLIEKGYSKVKEYSWGKMAQQTLEAYNKVLKS